MIIGKFSMIKTSSCVIKAISPVARLTALDARFSARTFTSPKAAVSNFGALETNIFPMSNTKLTKVGSNFGMAWVIPVASITIKSIPVCRSRGNNSVILLITVSPTLPRLSRSPGKASNTLLNKAEAESTSTGSNESTSTGICSEIIGAAAPIKSPMPSMAVWICGITLASSPPPFSPPNIAF